MSSSFTWRDAAQRIVSGANVEMGEIVLVRDHSGRYDVLQEVLLAIEEAGALPMPQILPARYLERMLRLAPLAYLTHWDHHRDALLEAAQRVIVLGGDKPDFSTIDDQSLHAYLSADERLTQIEEKNKLPFVVTAIPTAKRAYQLSMTLDMLDMHMLPALCMNAHALNERISQALVPLAAVDSMVVHSGARSQMYLHRGARAWLSDDGLIDNTDRLRGAIVSNLPAGSIYVPPLESMADGELFVPQLHTARDVHLFFEGGVIVEIGCKQPSEQSAVAAWLDSHSGGSRRISHIGIGLNPALSTPIGWTLVDEHIDGRVFLALGENRYMNGENESSLNHDIVLDPDAKIVPFAM
jgi:leucyl aminopeptidase (aminopeptidase T)